MAPLAVRVLYADGSPARRVCVRGANVSDVTDADGRVRFDAVKTGVADFGVYAHGFVATSVRIDVGHDADVVVREPAPRTVRVLVQDEAGRALPAACVQVAAFHETSPAAHVGDPPIDGVNDAAPACSEMRSCLVVVASTI